MEKVCRCARGSAAHDVKSPLLVLAELVDDVA